MEEHQNIGKAVAGGVAKVIGILLLRSAHEEDDFFLCALLSSARVYSCGLIWNHRDQAGGKAAPEVLHGTCVLSEV
jgi:hypothetical protein